MGNVHVEVCKGGDITFKDIKHIDMILQKAFPGNEPLDPKNRKLFSKDIFFIARNSEKRILSAGRLRPTGMVFLGKVYKIYGIADIVSEVKRKGYGKILVNSMIDYMNDKNKMGIGFCLRKNSQFYKKSGLKIAKGLIKRFFYNSPNNGVIKNGWDDDVIYTSSADNIIEKIQKHSNERVRILSPFW